jgi:hypothetical protein
MHIRSLLPPRYIEAWKWEKIAKWDFIQLLITRCIPAKWPSPMPLHKMPTTTSPCTQHNFDAYRTQRSALFCNNPPVIEGFDQWYWTVFKLQFLPACEAIPASPSARHHIGRCYEVEGLMTYCESMAVPASLTIPFTFVLSHQAIASSLDDSYVDTDWYLLVWKCSHFWIEGNRWIHCGSLEPLPPHLLTGLVGTILCHVVRVRMGRWLCQNYVSVGNSDNALCFSP